MRIVSILFAICVGQLSAVAQQDHPVLLRQVHLLQPGMEESTSAVDILMESGTISRIGPELSDFPAETEIISGEGKFVTVGFTDAHIHFFQNGGLYTRPDALDLRACIRMRKRSRVPGSG